MGDKYIKYRGLETSDEIIEAIINLVGPCKSVERDDNDDEDVRDIEPCKCAFCRVWAMPTDEEIREVEKQLPPGEYYWGIEKVVIK